MGEKETIGNSIESSETMDISPVTIPDGAIDLSEEKNGGVYKVSKRVGQGDGHPVSGDNCTVHYVGKLPDGTIFDSSRERDEPFTFTVGRSQVIKGWDLTIATMKKGELCEIIVKPESAYGEAGSPPRIPPNATLIFEIELLSWEGEDISPDHDRTITRTVLKEGDKYEYPNDGSKITAHIIGFCDEREFRNGEVEFVLGEATEAGFPEGMDKAVKRIRKGERSHIHLKSRWGYGRHGNQQYGIPPMAELDFDIWLKDFEKAKDTWQMSADEKLEEAEKLKTRGAEFFQQGKNKLAASKYKRILDLLQHETKYEGEKQTHRNTVYLAAHNNLAMIFLKTGETVEAIKHCDKVLSEDTQNVKALYRRAQAYQKQNDYDEAIRDYQAMLVLEPTNNAAQANIAKCKTGIVEVRKQQKALFANMFDKMAKSPIKETKDTSQGEKKAG